MLTVVNEDGTAPSGGSPLDESVRKGARRMPAAALAMVFELVEAARQRWRAVDALRLAALVRAGARFERGRLAERPEAVAA